MTDFTIEQQQAIALAKARRARAEASPALSAPEVALDTAEQTGIGTGEGVLGLQGLPGDMEALARKGSGWALGKMGFDEGLIKKAFESGPSLLPTSQQLEEGVQSVTGKFPEPKSTPGKYGRELGHFIPAMAGGEGSAGARFVTQALLPSIGSETAGLMSGNNKYAKIVGALVGAMSPAGARRLITPFPAIPGRQAAVDTLRAAGVHPTAGQATGHPMLGYAESEIGGGSFARRLNAQENQYTRAILQRAGVDAPRATTQVVHQAFTDIGHRFDDLAARNHLQVDQQLSNDVAAAARNYEQDVPVALRVPRIANLERDLTMGVGRTLPGEQYQSYRTLLDRGARAAGGNTQARDAYYGLRNALDDAMERTITAGGNTADIAAWQEARHHYRNLLVVEHAATARSPAAASGAISPSQLHGADQAVRGRRAYARGQTDYSDLAHAGEEVLIRPPQSGTAPRVAVRAIPAILGALLGHQVEGGLGAAVGAVAAPVVAGGTMMSRPVQAALGNQLMINAPDAAASARRALLIQALTAPRQLSAPDAQ